MPPRTQLDTLIGVMETREEALARQHAAAVQELAEAREAEAQVLDRLRRERPQGRSAADWRDAEHRAEGLRNVLKSKQEQALRQELAAAAARQALTSAHQRLEMLRKAAGHIRTGLLRAADHAENRAHDELTLLRFRRTG